MARIQGWLFSSRRDRSVTFVSDYINVPEPDFPWELLQDPELLQGFIATFAPNGKKSESHHNACFIDAPSFDLKEWFDSQVRRNLTESTRARQVRHSTRSS